MSKLNVLVVEDEILVATDIEECLISLGYAVQNCVATGAAAISEVEKNLPDVILMDIMLKGPMTGIEAADHIRKNHNVPIIYLTANADISTIQKAKISLPYGYIIKPFNEKDLQTNIEIARFKFENDLKAKVESDQFNRFFKQTIDMGEQVFLNTAKGLEKVNPSNVYFLQQIENKTVIHLSEDEITVPQPLNQLQDRFPSDTFIMVNEDFLVNIDKIFLASFPQIIIADKMTVITVDADKKDLLESKTGKH